MNREKISVSLDDLLSEIIDKEKRIEVANPEDKKALEERVLFLKGEIKKIHQKMSDLEDRVNVLEASNNEKTKKINNRDIYNPTINRYSDLPKSKSSFYSYKRMSSAKIKNIDDEAKKLIEKTKELDELRENYQYKNWINKSHMGDERNELEKELESDFEKYYEEGYIKNESLYDYEDEEDTTKYEKEIKIKNKINSNFLNNIIEKNKKKLNDYLLLKFDSLKEEEEYKRNVRIWFYRCCEDKVIKNSKYTDESQLLLSIYFLLSGIIILFFTKYIFFVLGGMLISLVFLKKKKNEKDVKWLKMVDEKIGLHGIENYNNHARVKSLSQVKDLYFPLPIILEITGVPIESFEEADYTKNVRVSDALLDTRIKNSLKMHISTLDKIK